MVYFVHMALSYGSVELTMALPRKFSDFFLIPPHNDIRARPMCFYHFVMQICSVVSVVTLMKICAACVRAACLSSFPSVICILLKCMNTFDTFE